MSLSVVENIDCMTRLREAPDNHWDLAICDPPYGLGIASNPIRQMHVVKSWDSAVPTEEYFTELRRVSVNQIIWGGNYFPLPPTQNLIVWDKKQPFNFSLAQSEFAWCSIQRPSKTFSMSPIGAGKFHPTQKPVALYKWLLKNYAKPGDKILDTHLGSQSSRIAAWDLGFDFVGYELDEDYFREGNERFERHRAQPTLFEAVSVTTQQTSLFTA